MKNLINPYWSNSFRGKTLEEYICEYNNLLEKYKLKQTDNDEINFIDNEIRYIKQYIKPITENKITEAEELGEIDLIKLVIESDLSKLFHF